MTDAPELVERVRTALDGRTVREVRMFGSLAFMVDERMLVAAGPAGDLLVRVDPAEGEHLARRPGAGVAVMGERSMGSGWLRVEADALASEDDLAFWLEQAWAFHGGRGDETRATT